MVQRLKKGFMDYGYMLFTACILFVYTFVMHENEVQYHATLDQDIIHGLPFFVGNPTYAAVALAGLFGLCFLVATRLRIRLDLIEVLLLLRIALACVPLLYTGFSTTYIANLWPYALAVIGYTAAKNTRGNIRQFYYLLVGFGLVLALQTLLVAMTNPMAYTDIPYKAYMVIPFGASNYIAAGLVICAVLGGYALKNKYIKAAYIVLLSLAAILTKSRGGVLVGGLVLCVFAAFRVRKIQWTPRRKKLLWGGVALALVALALLHRQVFAFFYGFIPTQLEGSFLDALTSGRISLFQEYLGYVGEYPLFGHGLFYALGRIKPHNFILSLLYENGVVGLLLFGVLLFFGFKTLKKAPPSVEKKAAWWVLGLILVTSLNEIVLFTPVIDFVFFSILGFFAQKKDEEGMPARQATG